MIGMIGMMDWFMQIHSQRLHSYDCLQSHVLLYHLVLYQMQNPDLHIRYPSEKLCSFPGTTKVIL